MLFLFSRQISRHFPHSPALQYRQNRERPPFPNLSGGAAHVGHVDGRVKALEEKLADRDAEEAVELALKNGKITPAQRGWAKGYALKSPDGFKEFLEKAPQAVPMSEIAGGDALALKGDKPDEATMLVCKQLGVSAEDVQKYGMKEE